MMTALLSAFCLAASTQAPESLVVRYERPLGDQISLSLATDRSSYYVGEPVKLRLMLKNIQQKTVRGDFRLDPVLGMTEVYYRKGDSAFARLKYLYVPGDYVGSVKVLKPEQEITGEVVLAFDPARQQFILGEAGSYEFQIIHRDAPDEPNAVVTSNAVRVEVAPPPGGEQEALASYSRELAMLAQFDPGRSYVAPEHIKAAAQFLERFPNSPYALRLREGLQSALYHRVGRNRATKEERELLQKLQAERAPNQ